MILKHIFHKNLCRKHKISGFSRLKIVREVVLCQKEGAIFINEKTGVMKDV